MPQPSDRRHGCRACTPGYASVTGWRCFSIDLTSACLPLGAKTTCMPVCNTPVRMRPTHTVPTPPTLNTSCRRAQPSLHNGRRAEPQGPEAGLAASRAGPRLNWQPQRLALRVLWRLQGVQRLHQRGPGVPLSILAALHDVVALLRRHGHYAHLRRPGAGGGCVCASSSYRCRTPGPGPQLPPPSHSPLPMPYSRGAPCLEGAGSSGGAPSA